MKKILIFFMVTFVIKMEAINIFNTAGIPISCSILAKDFEERFLLRTREKYNFDIPANIEKLTFEGVPILKKIIQYNLIVLRGGMETISQTKKVSSKDLACMMARLLKDRTLKLKSRSMLEEKALWEKKFEAIIIKTEGKWHTNTCSTEYISRGHDSFIIYEIKDGFKLVN